ncbi:hypothetical protein ILUMI_12807 [Ignelater luminosus]|uniref:Uncharacterized protein n=1 Tax=Ignelater luminosus TaxID=2038154 RepID=A0A8K0CXT0_IGNLU|nr:hypothetical protein ILUMI_12807 [Ignelater luminosus]
MEYRPKVALIARDKLCKIFVKKTVILRRCEGSRFGENPYYRHPNRPAFYNFNKQYKKENKWRGDIGVLEAKGPSSRQMRDKLLLVAPACDRTGISDRSAAIIAFAVLRDVGIISEEDPSFIVDRSKIRRERSQMIQSLQNNNEIEQLIALYFDGRRDKILNVDKVVGIFHRSVKIEDHYILLKKLAIIILVT